MKKNALILITAVALLGMVGSASAHLPEGVTFVAWNWPSTHLPTLDGDLSEWNVLPEDYWIGLDDTWGGASAGNEPVLDLADFNFRFAIGWNDEEDRIYFAQEWIDDYFQRSDAFAGGCCAGNDKIEMGIDADHSGTESLRSSDDVPAYNGAQAAHWGMPEIAPRSWMWMWLSETTWADKAPYTCCPDAYQLDGGHGLETTLTSEWYSVAWDDFDPADPNAGTLHDFQAGEIFGWAGAWIDNDGGDTDEELAASYLVWTAGGANMNDNATDYADVLLLEPDFDRLPTAVENDSWGHIKASFAK